MLVQVSPIDTLKLCNNYADLYNNIHKLFRLTLTDQFKIKRK